MKAECLRSDGRLRLRNEQVELVLREQDGQVLEIWNRRLDWNFKGSAGGAWPISYWVRHPMFPWWGGRPRQLPPCPEEYVSPPEIRISRRRGGTELRLQFAELAVHRREEIALYPGALDGTATPEILHERERAGVAGTVDIRLPDNADYFLLRATVDLRRSRCDLVRFASGSGGALRADEDPAHERLAAPEWWGGALYDHPREFIPRRDPVNRRLVWPYIGGASNSLLAGWLDFYGRRGGLGLGYLGRSGQMVAFEAGIEPDGLSLLWRTFDLSGVGTYFGDHAPGYAGLYPLESGRSWTSDWWIVAPHEGDWHRMADIYREEYRQAFGDEMLRWAEVSEPVRNADVILPANFHHGIGGGHFDQFPAAVAQTVRDLGVEPQRSLVWVINTQKEGFDTTFPDFFPMHDVCGGEAAARRAIAALDAQGIGGTFIYTNPNFDHVLAGLYVKQADTRARANHGNFACFASPAWQQMWLEQLLPRLLDTGACGIQIDQWPLLFCPCRRKGHGHRTDSVSVLRGQVLGKRRWLRAFRAAAQQRDRRWFFFSEAGTDLVGGLADLWTFGGRAFHEGGHPLPEIARFTHPELVMTTGQATLDSLVNGALGVMAGVPGYSAHGEAPRTIAARPEFQEYLRVRAELRAARAPGFPYGFRDTLGLTVPPPDLKARSYRDKRGITVVYYAPQAVNAAFEVQPAALGHAGRSSETVWVTLAAGQAGWWSRTYA